ncbi:MAG: hypothetical protein U9N34_10110 [Candidatus Cloacimonadota bacterium]|nr:hypothetical protein [Candidatus Cloacimonadota bacterium]
MLAIRGIFDNGKIKLSEKVNFSKPLKVIVTFLEDIQEEKEGLIDLNKYSFIKSQKVLKDFKGSLSDTVIAERRIEL